MTASRTPIPVGETGNSVTILTREAIEQRGNVFLADLLRGIPGLAISRSGPAGALTELRVRGAEANHLQVRIDGVDVSDTFGADALPLELIVADSIERIEFVRGPQSGLWGSEAVAGVLHITTRGFEGRGSSVNLETGSFGTVRGGARIGFGDDRLHVDATLSYLNTDGSNISRQGGERDGAENTTASARLDWRPAGERFSLNVVARHTDSTSDFDDTDFVTTGLPVDADNYTDTTLTTVRVNGSWDAPESRWSHGLALASTGSDSTTTLGGIPSGSSTAVDKLALSAQSTVTFGSAAALSGHKLTMALDHESRDFTQRGTASFFGDPNQDQRVKNTGLALEHRFHAGEHWATSAAIRHDNNSEFSNVTTFRLTGSWSLGKTRLRAAIGTGQKAPTFIERFGFFPASFVGNPNLKPESSKGFEVGVDQEIGERVRLSATYFNDRLEDEINGFFFDPIAGAFTAMNISGKSDRQGIELTFDAALGRRVDLNSSYTFTDATDPTDLEELRRPRHLASLFASWRGAGGRFKIRGGLHRTGTQADIFFPPFPQPSETVRLDAYLAAELTATMRVARRLELVVRGENLLDEEYENVFGFRASGAAAYLGLRFLADGN